MLTKEMKIFINSPMPYMVGANLAYMYECYINFSFSRTEQDLQKVKGVTILNIDDDHLFLPQDLMDYYERFPSASGYHSLTPIPDQEIDTILPPLPTVDGICLYTEVHILFSIIIVILIRFFHCYVDCYCQNKSIMIMRLPVSLILFLLKRVGL